MLRVSFGLSGHPWLVHLLEILPLSMRREQSIRRIVHGSTDCWLFRGRYDVTMLNVWPPTNYTTPLSKESIALVQARNERYSSR